LPVAFGQYHAAEPVAAQYHAGEPVPVGQHHAGPETIT
jgi:hypothetical protein